MEYVDERMKAEGTDNNALELLEYVNKRWRMARDWLRTKLPPTVARGRWLAFGVLEYTLP